MPAKIEACHKPIHKIFGGDYNLVVPSYQRPYTWTTDEAGQLLGDLNDWVQRESGNFTKDSKGLLVENVNPYFLGSVVLIKEEGKSCADIVDGQQRLITLSLLLVAMRENAPMELKEHITTFLKVSANPLTGKKEGFPLLPRERDQDFYKRRILADSIDTAMDTKILPHSQRNMLTNARFFLDEIKGLGSGEINHLLTALLQQCFLVVVSTPDFDSAYRIFSVLNDRGIDLAATDILKADIIGGIRADARDDHTKTWEEVEDHLGRDDFQALFAHIRMIHMRTKISENLVDEMRRVILPKFQPLENFIEIEIEPYAKILSILRNADYAATNGAEDVNQIIRHLDLITNADWVPPALLFFRKHKNDAGVLKRFLGDLERLAVSMMIRREDVNARIRKYAEVIRHIDEGKDLFAENSPLQLLAAEKRATLEALDDDVYSYAKQWGAAVLRRLNNLLGERAIYPPKVTIEHVLPQNPADNSKWMQSFPDSEMRERWTNRLANLVLLSRKKNSKAQNFDFEKKKSGYFNSPATTFAITVDVLQENEWTLAVLDQRQKRLLDILAKQWRLR